MGEKFKLGTTRQGQSLWRESWSDNWSKRNTIAAGEPEFQSCQYHGRSTKDSSGCDNGVTMETSWAQDTICACVCCRGQTGEAELTILALLDGRIVCPRHPTLNLLILLNFYFAFCFYCNYALVLPSLSKKVCNLFLLYRSSQLRNMEVSERLCSFRKTLKETEL